MAQAALGRLATLMALGRLETPAALERRETPAAKPEPIGEGRHLSAVAALVLDVAPTSP